MNGADEENGAENAKLPPPEDHCDIPVDDGNILIFADNLEKKMAELESSLAAMKLKISEIQKGIKELEKDEQRKKNLSKANNLLKLFAFYFCHRKEITKQEENETQKEFLKDEFKSGIGSRAKERGKRSDWEFFCREYLDLEARLEDNEIDQLLFDKQSKKLVKYFSMDEKIPFHILMKIKLNFNLFWEVDFRSVQSQIQFINNYQPNSDFFLVKKFLL